METTDSTTGNSDEQTGEDALRCERGLSNALPHLRDIRHLHKQHRHQGYSHKQQGECEQGVNLSDNLIDRHHRGNDIIHEDDNNPECTVTQYPDAWHTAQAQFLQQQSRTVHKHGSYHHQQENRENQHNLLWGITQVFSNNLRQVSATVTNTQHTAQIVVRSTCKDTSEDNPEIGSRSELGTHDGTKDRSSTCNVQELYHENLP